MPSKKSARTRERLLSAAGDVFVEKGFRDATVAEICARAGANIAAVNYYFGGKEALYQEAWRHCLAESLRAHPPDGCADPAAPPEERLRERLRALMGRIADPETKDFFISQMEIANPTGLLEEVMMRELIPMREKTLAMVRELLGPDADERQVVFCEACIISMCVHPLIMRRLGQKTPNARMPVIVDDLDAFADHVVRFALAGIHASRTPAKAS